MDLRLADVLAEFDALVATHRCRYVPASIKLVPGEVITERVGVQHSGQHFRAGPLLDASVRLGLPDEGLRFVDERRRVLSGLHLCFEHSSVGVRCKLYLESNSSAARTEMSRRGRAPDSPTVTHVALKWGLPNRSMDTSVYVRPDLARARVTGWAERMLTTGSAVWSLVGPVITEATSLAAFGKRTTDVLDVSDVRSARRSFDIAVGDTGATLHRLAPRWRDVEHRLRLPESTFAADLENDRRRLLRIAAGTDHQAREFLTVYVGSRQSAGHTQEKK